MKTKNSKQKIRMPNGGSQQPLVRLGEFEFIVTAYAEPAAGPGWANSPLWIVIANKATGKWRQDCLQPDEQTAEMSALYAFSALAHGRMTGLVERIAANRHSLRRLVRRRM